MPGAGGLVCVIPHRVEYRELVWAKVRKELPTEIRTVYVVPDAALCHLPWSALPGDKPGTILLEDFAVASIPHAPFLLDKLLPPDSPPNRSSKILVVGGVKYDADLPPSTNVAFNRRDPDKIGNLAACFRGKFEVVPGTTEIEPMKVDPASKAHARFWAAFMLSGPGR